MSSDTTSSMAADHPIYSNTEFQVDSDGGIDTTEAITRAIDINDNLKPEEKTEIKEWIKSKKELRIIVTGKTGAGKSSLLNCFVGTKLFNEGDDLDPCTLVVDQHKCERDGITVIAWDCPGLQDGTDNEEEYLKDLVEKTERNIDLMIYCVDMSATRATDLRVHGSAIQKLTEILGPGVWSNTVIALTFANLYETRIKTIKPGIKGEVLDTEFKKQIDLWKAKLQQALSEVGVSDFIINALPVCPAGYYTIPHLPGHPLWASQMWVTMLCAVKEYAQPLPLILNVERFREKIELSDEHFLLPPEEQPIFISEQLPCYSSLNDNSEVATGGALVGATTLGAASGGLAFVGGVIAGVTVGVAAGTTAGGVVGGIIAGAATFGVGTALGIALGAGIGAGIGIATNMLINLYRRRKQNQNAE